MDAFQLEQLGLRAEEGSGGLKATLELAEGFVLENPVTRQPLPPVTFQLTSDRLIPIAPPAVVGLPSILLGAVRNRAEISQLLSSAYDEHLFHLERRSAQLETMGLQPKLDPQTLATVGPHDFNGGYKSPTFTAHPKVDGRTGEMIAYGYEAEGLASNAIWLYTIAPDGTVTSERKLAAPYLSMVHDIAISQNFILIPVYGMVSSMERLRAGKVHWGWDDSVPSYIGVVPRRGNGEVVWIAGPEMALD